MKNVFLFKFRWSVFLKVQLTLAHNGLALNRRQAIIWTDADRVQTGEMS